jgi:ABC-type amino acid transport substrate-binding protein
VAGFALPDSRGTWQGLDVDLCRGLAAAIFNDASKVRFVPLSASQRFTALGSGEIDVLIRTSTMTMLRDTTLGIRHVATYFYDGHGFMVKRDSGITRARDMNGASICLVQGTTNEQVTATTSAPSTCLSARWCSSATTRWPPPSPPAAATPTAMTPRSSPRCAPPWATRATG